MTCGTLIFHSERTVVQHVWPRGPQRFHHPRKGHHNFKLDPASTFGPDPLYFASHVPKVFHHVIAERGLGNNPRWWYVAVEVDRYGAQAGGVCRVDGRKRR